ncbi:MAG: ergothioneine biosynthesis protein EgtB [Pseudomonadota bacterium]|nr:ergothioneine biosynthesis protein EgtB [Pseudomonadota bacterium]
MHDDRANLTPSHGLAAAYGMVRNRSLQLAEPLSDEDCGAQSMPDASPVKWHLAHTTWFFETFLLEPREAQFVPFDPAFRVLFNSYYNGVGARHPRPRRGLLTRPGMREVRAYRANVDARMVQLLAASPHDAALAALVELGLQHEQQHQELILTDVLHLLAQSPLYPAYDARMPATGAPPAEQWIACEGGLVDIGFDGPGFSFDNELPRHRVYLQPYALAAQLVTNSEFLAFIDAGGYADAALWLSEGWDAVAQNGVQHPLYWVRQNDGWYEFTLQGLQPLDLARPLTHVSLFEADAYARWAGARLPLEAEWEVAAQQHGADLRDLFGVCWQWTASSYAPYPGYAPAVGALGEYNGKFMINQYVLRGSSMATPSGHARASYRNFFPAGTRWQFAGVRLAR